MIQKSTFWGIFTVVLATAFGYYERDHLRDHYFHTGLIAFFEILGLALILNDDERILKFARVFLPWIKGGMNGTPPSP